MPEPTPFNIAALLAAAFGAYVAAAMWVGGRMSTRDGPGDVELVSSLEFGGGWAFPKTQKGRTALELFFGEPPYELYPFGGELGYIVEPQDVAALLACLRDENVRWSFR